MDQPQGYTDISHPTNVCTLCKAIYGLKHAPREWNDALKHTLRSWGFSNSKVDTLIFMLCTGTSILLLLVYVDDVIITSSDNAMNDKLVSELNSTFSLNDLVKLNYFLWIQVHYLPYGLILNQEKYVDDILHKLNWSDLNSCSLTHVYSANVYHYMMANLWLTHIFIEASLGPLQYLTHTQSVISFIVNHLSQYLQAPTGTHWLVVKRVMRYLICTKDYGIRMQPSSDLDITTFSDTDSTSNLMIVNLWQPIVSFLVTTLSLSLPRNRQWWLDQAFSWSAALLHKLRLRWFG